MAATPRSILAVEIDSDSMRAVTFHKGATRWRTDAPLQWALGHDEADSGSRTRQIRQALAEAVERAGWPAPAVWATLPRGTAFIRAVSIPRAARRELRQLLALRAAQEIPQFDPQSVIWDYEILADGNAKSPNLTVALCAVRREALDRFLADFSAINIRPDVLDLAPLTLARRFGKPIDPNLPGDFALVDLGDAAALIIRFSHGRPVQFGQTPIDGQAIRRGDKGATERFALELQFALEQRESLSNDGIPEPPRPAQWIALSGPEDLRALTMPSLEEGMGIEVRLLENCAQNAEDASDVPLHVFQGRDQVLKGLLRRATQKGPAANLAPEARKPSEWRKRWARAASLPVLASLAAVLALAIVFLGREMRDRKTKMVNEAAAQIKPLNPKLDYLKATVDTLATYEKDRFSWLEVLKELNQIQPKGITLTQLTMEKEGKVSMQGTAPKQNPMQLVEQFQTALNESSYFKTAEVGTVNTPKSGNNAVFNISCALSDAAKKGF